MDNLLFGLIIFSMIAYYIQNEKRVSRIWKIEAKVDLMMKHLGLTYDPYEDIGSDVKDAVARGDTIVAIKLLREATAMPLGEAKTFVEELKRRAGTTS